MIVNDFVPKNPLIFSCKICDYITSNKKDFVKHAQTKKHFFNENQCLSMILSPKIPRPYECDCGKKYKDYSGLWRHKQKYKNCDENSQKVVSEELVLELIKDNKELKTIILEQNKTIQGLAKNSSTNINHSNSHNKTFNLQFFLNETCKDALNITDFVNSINVQLNDLETTGQLGYVEGISKVVIKNLQDLETRKRPIHCSDNKREILYIKESNQWIKEEGTKDVMKNMIKLVANKNMRQIPEWVKLHPDCFDSTSRTNDRYLKIVSNSMSGSSIEEQQININKIISKVAKQIIIDK